MEPVYRTFAGRRPTREVRVGATAVGGSNPIRVQSMLTSDTMDTEACVRETLGLVAVGCEIVRITAPTVKDAKNLEMIRAALRAAGCEVPLVADIHFKPDAAMEAALWVDKVRINPGNFADSKKFATREYSDAEYEAEIGRIRERFSPLVQRCKDRGVAMRIGTNHGSLSDRIMNRYGDTPRGMVESALEFARIARESDYHALIFSMKASNPKVMIEAYRLLVARLDELDQASGAPASEPGLGEALPADSWSYPIHLGVTEAGDSEDGRIKSAIGIGSLLMDGIGDTIRVSLTEDSVHEIPVAKALVALAETRRGTAGLPVDPNADTAPTGQGRVFSKTQGGAGACPGLLDSAPLGLRGAGDWSGPKVVAQAGLGPLPFDPFSFSRRASLRIEAADVPLGGDELVRVVVRRATYDRISHKLDGLGDFQPEIVYEDADVLEIDPRDEAATAAANALSGARLVTIPDSCPLDIIPAFRLLAARIDARHPILLKDRFGSLHGSEDFLTTLLTAATHIGALLCDGIGDALIVQGEPAPGQSLRISYNILQAAGVRIFKTDYVACPSCGRTLFNLQETTARIKAATVHLKGVKIAIMGCIVNGPGEMADADFGYVGGAPGKVNLYVGKTPVKFNIPEAEAVDQLVDLIKDHGRWFEPAEIKSA